MNEFVPFEDIQKEAAKAFGKETAAIFFGFLADITRPPAKELGGLLTDHLKFFRFKTQLKILKKATEIHSLFGSRPQVVPLKFLADLFDNCSWEEDEDMQTRWAALLANASKKGESTTDYATYVEILRQLTPSQVMCLEVMYEERNFPARRRVRELPSYQSSNTLMSVLNISNDQFKVLFDNLERLNLIHIRLSQDDDDFTFQTSAIEKRYDESSLTYLGKDLIEKCRIHFTKEHKERIRIVCMEKIDEVARDPTGEPLITMFNSMKEVYGYLIENDIRSAVWNSLCYFIWKGSQVKPLGELPLGTDLRIKIVDMILENLNQIHG